MKSTKKKKPKKKKLQPGETEETCPKYKRLHIVDQYRGWSMVIRKQNPTICPDCED